MLESAYILAGGLTGLIVGLTGVGGGALMTPILLLIFGVATSTAVATDLWFAAITKIIGASIHCRYEKAVDWEVVKRLWWGSLPASLFVTILMGIGARVHKIDGLSEAIGFVVLLTAISILFAPWLYRLAEKRDLARFLISNRLQAAMTILAGMLLGVCVSLTSIGAGALGSIMLLYLYPLRMDPHRLVATDIVHAIPLAFLAGIGYLFNGLVDWRILTNLLVGSIPGVIMGSLIARQFSSRWMQVTLAMVLLMVGIKTIA